MTVVVRKCGFDSIVVSSKKVAVSFLCVCLLLLDEGCSEYTPSTRRTATFMDRLQTQSTKIVTKSSLVQPLKHDNRPCDHKDLISETTSAHSSLKYTLRCTKQRELKPV